MVKSIHSYWNCTEPSSKWVLVHPAYPVTRGRSSKYVVHNAISKSLNIGVKPVDNSFIWEYIHVCGTIPESEVAEVYNST